MADVGNIFKAVASLFVFFVLFLGGKVAWGMPPSEDPGDIVAHQPTSQASMSSPGIEPAWPGPGPAHQLVEDLARLVEEQLSQYRLVTVDGGGVRGAFPAQVIGFLEKSIKDRLKKEVYYEATDSYVDQLTFADFFKGGFTGTSTGSFISLGLARQKPYSPDEIVRFYTQNASAIFPNWYQCPRRGWCFYPGFWSWEAAWAAHGPCKDGCRGSFCQRFWCAATSLLTGCGCFGCCYNCKGFCGPQYGRRALDAEIDRLFKDSTLGEVLAPVQATTFNLKNGQIQYLGSTDPLTARHTQAVAALCSSAAPTYLGGVRVEKGSIGVDGGLFENNPVVAGLRQAMDQRRNYLQQRSMTAEELSAHDFFVLSLGTGQPENPPRLPGLQHAGAAAWAKPAIDIGMDGSSEALDRSMARILGSDKYIRLQGKLSPRLMALDASRNVTDLIQQARAFCETSDRVPQVIEYVASEYSLAMKVRRHLGGLDYAQFGLAMAYFSSQFPGPSGFSAPGSAREKMLLETALQKQQWYTIEEFQRELGDLGLGRQIYRFIQDIRPHGELRQFQYFIWVVNSKILPGLNNTIDEEGPRMAEQEAEGAIQETEV